MKALILAAGMGSRLKYKTKNKPKCLVSFKGKPILEHQLSALHQNGINQIVIVVGYKKKKLINYLKRFKKKFFFEIILNNKYKNTDSAFSYFLANKNISNQNYIHMNSDIIFSKKTLEKIILSKKNIIASSRDLKLGEKMDLINFTKNFTIKKFDNKYFSSAQTKIFGLAKFSSSIQKNLFKLIKNDIEKGKRNEKCFSYFRQIIKKKVVYTKLFSKKDIKETNTLKDFK